MSRCPATAFTFVLVFLLGIAAPSTGQVYKWVDNEGKTHFTDSLDSVPEEFRSQLPKKKLPDLSTVEDVSAPATQAEGEEAASAEEEKAASDKAKKEEEEKKKPEGPSPEEIAAAGEAATFLRGSIARYQSYEGSIPNTITNNQLYDLFQSEGPEKEALAEKLGGMELPELKQTAAYLKSSLAADKKFRTAGPMLTVLTRQALSRLKSEEGQKQALIEKLEAVQSANP